MKAFCRRAWVAALLLCSAACALSPYDVMMPLAETLSSIRQSATPTLPPIFTPGVTALPAAQTPSPTATRSPSNTLQPPQTLTPQPGTATVTIINHAPFTVYVELQGSQQSSYALAAASRMVVQIQSGSYPFRLIVSGEQVARGTHSFPEGDSTWEIYDTPTLVDSPTPMWTGTP
jgi:hypothetical protein